MIASLKGKISVKTNKSITVAVGDIGYEVFVTPLFLEKTNEGDDINIFTYQYVREELMELYGFKNLEEREFFKQLIAVSGVGPKSALTIMSLASVKDLKKAIVHEDTSVLTKVSGVGSKTAGRIVVELKNKIEKMSEDEDGINISIVDSEAVDAMVSLGYSAKEAREGLARVDPSVEGVSQRVQAALKLLGRRG